MRVTTADGEVYEGADAAAILEQLRVSQWSGVVSSEQYAQDVRERVREMVGVELRIDTPEHLLDDLVSAGLMTYGTPTIVAGDFGDEKP